ncbi:MAG: hypothetical protein GTN64_08570 [Candidatus Latescibacteria bacterium]|nr:hypothetical protein [Candidatus Latescibacterota bacterium]NIO78652.1 hypothetical protein [Candidatus Latescibacterota bacterium]
MGLLFGKVNVDDKDLQAIGVMVEESTSSVNKLSAAATKIAEAIEAVAAVLKAKRVSAFWGLLKVE